MSVRVFEGLDINADGSHPTRLNGCFRAVSRASESIRRDGWRKPGRGTVLNRSLR